MSDTLPNIAIPKGTWVDVYALTGIIVGTKLNVENTGTCDVYLAVQATQPDPDHNEYNILKRTGPKMTNHAGDSGAWAFCGHSDGELNVSVKSLDGFSPVLPGTEFDAMIEISDRGTTALGVFVQDQTTPVLDVPFLELVSDTSTLLNDTVVNSRFVTLTPGHAFTGASVGNIVEIANGDTTFFQSEVLGLVGDVLEFNSPMSKVFLAGDTVFESSRDLLVDGSVTPRVFSIQPLPTQQGDMVRIMLTIDSTAPQDFSTFGSAAALPVGITLRVNNGDGTYRNIFTFRDNGEWIERCFDKDFLINNGNNVRSFITRRTFGSQGKNGVVIRLDGALLEQLEVYINDDMTGVGGNIAFRMYAQGHELQEAA